MSQLAAILALQNVASATSAPQNVAAVEFVESLTGGQRLGTDFALLSFRVITIDVSWPAHMTAGS